MKRALLLVLTLLTAAGSGHARERLWSLFDWRDGLPVSYISGIAQDQDGFLWLGTPGGVVRFDGREMHRLTRGSALVLPGSGVAGVYFLDAQGAMFEFDEDRPVPVPGPDGDPLESVLQVSVGDDGGLWVVQEGRLRHRDSAGVWSEMSDRFDGSAGGLAALGPGTAGTLLATDDRAILRFETDGSVRTVGAVAAAIVAIDLGDGRTIVAGAGGEIVSIEEGRSRTIHTRHARPIHIAERGDALWVAYDDALIVLREGRDADMISVREDIPAPGSLLVDREGSLWVGSWRGLLHFPEPDTVGWRPEHPVVGRSLARGPGFLVMTSWGETLLAEESLHGWTVRSAPVGAIAPACVDGRGHVFTAAGEKLIEWTPDGLHREHAAPGHRGAWRCSASSDGGRWIGTTGGLILIEPAGGLRLLSGPEGAAPALELPTYVPFESTDGTLFVAKGEQICSAPASEVRSGEKPDWICETFPGAESVRDMLETSGGQIWAGTGRRGVFRFREGRFELIQASVDLPSTWLAGIALSPRGGVWIFGQGTVVRVEERPATEQGWAVVESLSAWEGLPTNNVSDLHEDGNGDVWLATDASLVRVPASARAVPLEPPRVALVEAIVDGRPVRADEVLDLPRQRSRLELRFAALSYRDPGRIRYRSRLRSDEPWSAAMVEPVFRFEGFAAGRYEMEVQASLDQTNWSPSAAAIAFRVPRPWYLRAWFLVLIALASAAVVFVVSRARAAVRSRLERQRVRIARDLHDELGSGLGGIGILAGLVARETLDPHRRRELSGQMQKATGELSGSLTDLVWSLKPGASTLRSLVSHLVERGSDLFPEDKPSFALEIPERMPSIPLSPSVRRNVSRIGLEALHNAAKHSGARTVTLGLVRTGRRLVLTVTDDGRGFGDVVGGEHDGAHGLGLAGMRRRAEAVGASLSVVSHAGEGTQVRLVFDPQADEHTPTHETSHDRAT